MSPDALVRGWTEAFNAQDLEGMLACLDESVVFHPLRLSGLAGCYRGHDGVREWFERLGRLQHDLQLAARDMRDLGNGRVLSSGSLTLAATPTWGRSPRCTGSRVN
jgi:hypothetical protein